MEWMADPQAWMALATLTALEIVLGIDNIIFISILVGRLHRPAAQPGAVDRSVVGATDPHQSSVNDYSDYATHRAPVSGVCR